MEDFVNTIWPQKCGDSLKVIEKSNIRTKNGKGEFLYKIEFLKYPYISFARKYHIKQGNVGNPEIESQTFIGQEFAQYCGDILRVLSKTSKKNKSGNLFYECEFLKYPCKVLALKQQILSKYVPNPNLDKRELYLNEIQKYFNYKPTLKELSLLWKIQEESVGKRIRENNLTDYVSYYFKNGSQMEEEIRKFCISLDNNFLIKSNWKELGGQEIDIYNPISKIGFEFNGNYWHSNEFKDKDYHLNKLKLANSKGIRLYYIWEDEWKYNQNQIKQWIQDILSQGYSNLFVNEIDKIGFIEEEYKISCPQLIKRGNYYCYNCGYLN